MAFFDRIGYRGLEGCGLLFWRESSLPSSTPAPQSPFFVLATDRVGIERLTGASLVRGAQTYANPATRPTLRQAASVLPESGRSRLRVRIRNCWSARAFAEVGRAFLFRCGNRLRYRFLFTIIGNTCQSGTAARYQLNAGEVFQDQAPMIALAFEQCVTSGFGYWRVLTDYIALRWISSAILGFLRN